MKPVILSEGKDHAHNAARMWYKPGSVIQYNG